MYWLRGARTDAEGITPGDIIVAIGDQPVDNVSKLLSRLDDTGQGVRVTVLRESGKTRSRQAVRKPG
ncbi:MAG: hypothetical protein ACREWG_03430 [Gammaproteobacteria bacterium]